MSKKNNDNKNPFVLLSHSLSKKSSIKNCEILPLNIQKNNEKILESAGVEFSGRVEDDELFLYVKLPEGWRIECSHSSYCSFLYDNNKKIRALIFYSSATPSRSGFLHVYEYQED